MGRVPEFARAWFLAVSARAAFRVLVVAGAIAMLLITWPTWQVRELPPLLPLAAVPQFSMGWAIVGSLLLVLLTPRVGLALYAGLSVFAVLQDQTRMLPHVASWFFLLLGTLPTASSQLVGRAYLIGMWFFAGWHKLVSPNFFSEVALPIWRQLLPSAPEVGGYILGVAIIGCELGLAVMAAMPRTRRVACWLALTFHLGTFAALSPLGMNFSPLIWPWNVVLAFAGFGLLGDWKTSLIVDARRVGIVARAAACLVLVMPVGYYLGVVDAHLAHNLFAHNKPIGTIHTLSSDINVEYAVADQLGVPLPANHVAFEAYFRATGKPGQSLEIVDPRWCARVFGYSHRRIPFRAVGSK